MFHKLTCKYPNLSKYIINVKIIKWCCGVTAVQCTGSCTCTDLSGKLIQKKTQRKYLLSDDI